MRTREEIEHELDECNKMCYEHWIEAGCAHDIDHKNWHLQLLKGFEDRAADLRAQLLQLLQ